MKATAVFLLLSLALYCYNGNAEMDGAADEGTQAACGTYDLKGGCPKIFDPICGTDNTVYSNECVLCAQNLKRNTNVHIKNRGLCKNHSSNPNFAEN